MGLRSQIIRSTIVTFAISSIVSVWAAAPANTPEYFETKIRPILASNCYACHTNSKLGGLRLDSRESMLKGGESGPAIVPGDPEHSLLVSAIRQTGKLKMPMSGKLKPEDVATMEEWIKAGAVWPANAGPVISQKADEYVITKEQRAFWSIQPIKVTPAPAVKDTKWARTEIDRFILSHLEKEGLQPVGPADKRTLIRRASLDLTGLPPKAEEVDAFLKDQSPDAYAKVVDKLLASPRYGERWGRLWLDIARYGEDDYRSLDPQGRGLNPYPFAYKYRDWVIKALNDDLPYHQFVKAQLAADLMDEKQRVKMLPGLGFLGLGPWFYDNGAVEITHADERHDRIDVVSRGFLGLTVGCARCHNHKYDPIPTADYYSLAGVFASTTYHEYPMVPQAVVDEYKTQEKKLKDKEELMGKFMMTESRQLAEALVLQSSKYMMAAWKITGADPKKPIAKVVEEGKLDYELMERWVKFLGRAPKHYPYLKDWQAMIARRGSAEEAQKLADQFQTTLLEVMFAHNAIEEENDVIKAKALEGTKKKERANKPNEFITNDDFCPGCGLEVKSLPLEKTNLYVDVFQRDLDEAVLPGNGRMFSPGLLQFRGWGLERQLSAERRAYLNTLREDIEKTSKAMPPEYPYVHGVIENKEPTNMPISLRGSPYNLGKVTPRGFLSLLAPDGQRELFTKGSGRMDLADAILAQPIASRVIVNRVWKWHLGTGLVNTPSNFGVTGERPTNPELLDYLADRFQKDGMSLKKLHREIMLSSVYQLGNEMSKAAFDKDAGNRLYWRFNRRRMEAEQIRDSLMEVSGSLDDKLFGPSEPLTPQFKRRTVYGKVSRYRLDDYLQLFDFPSPNLTAEQRFSTTVPLQRLFFMNSDFMQQQAELLAQRVAEEPNNTARITKAYRLIYGRTPTPEELKLGLEYLKTEPLREYEEHKKAEEEKLAKAKEKAAKEGKPDPSLAGLKGAPGGYDEDDEDGMPAGMDPTGMMAGMGGKAKGDSKAELLPVTPWGRYAKILLSSAEFTFIN